MPTRVVLLGTGTPNAEPDRAGSCVAVVTGGRPYLVDFGPGVVRRAAAAHQAGIAELDVPRLDRAFLTHLHSDHTAGYTDLILTPWVLGRSAALEVYGPQGLQHLTDHLLQAYAGDIELRLKGPEPCNTTGHRVRAREVSPGPVYRDEHVEVTAFAVSHGAGPAYGYRFTTPDRTVVISGDTAPTPELAEHYRNCDVLVHEAYCEAGLLSRPPEWQQYHAAMHTSARQLAEIANEAEPKLLVLVHQLCWDQSVDALLAELREGYDGEVVSGKDLDVI